MGDAVIRRIGGSVTLILMSSLVLAASAAPPPPTRVDGVVETLHGTRIVDPYRWLEDGAAPAVTAWTDAQNSHTRGVLDAFSGRAALETRLWSLFEIGSIGAPVPRPVGTGRARRWRYFYTRRDGKQNQAVLYVRDGVNGVDRALVDVNALAADGTRALDWWFPSEDGRLVAYGVSSDGSEESMLRVRDVATGRDLVDAIARTRACSVAWLPDGSGFFYTRYPSLAAVPPGEETYHRQVFFHRLGTAPPGDPLIFGGGRDLKDWPSVALSPDGRFLGIEVSQGWSKSELYVVDRAQTGDFGPAIPIVVDTDAIFDLAEITNDALLVRTNEGASRYRLMRVPLPAGPTRRASRSSDRPSSSSSSSSAAAAGTASAPLPRSAWQEVIPEAPSVLQQVALVGQTLAALYLEDAASRIKLFDRQGAPAGDVALPMLGTAGGLYGHNDGNELFLPFSSFLAPTTILRQALGPPAKRARARASATSPGSAPVASPPPPSVWRQIPSPVSPDSFVVTRDRVRSKDGTVIPLFLVHRRDVAVDRPGGQLGSTQGGRKDGPEGGAPTVLYGYGGFNVDITPAWAPSVVPFLEKGGVYAVAVLRGGGEYGEAWHQAGMLGRKQNVFDDFIAAAEHLIATKVTSPARLAIMGRSNGGLLVGAALTQRPELFRAVVCGVPLLDMIRYHRFRIAKLWIPEYGSADEADAFAWLLAYSPYHRVRDGVAYPAVMLVTAASDTRVDPLHARKMTARLQAATRSNRPVLLRLETQAGHGAGKPLAKVISQTVDEWSFVFAELGLH